MEGGEVTDRATITVNQLRVDDGMDGGGQKVRGGKEGGVQFIWISKERQGGGGVGGVGEDTEDKDKWALMVGLWA